jgi:short-subunit dehydrogenase
VVEALAKKKMRVVALARDAVHLEKVARAFRGAGAAFILTALDIYAPDVNADEFKKAESWRR